MYIHNRALYDMILKREKILLSYHTYPVGTKAVPYIAQDTSNVENFTDRPSIRNSVLVNMVDLLLNEAINRCFYQYRTNKEAVCCKVEGIEELIYFVAYGQQRILTTAIDGSRGSERVNILGHYNTHQHMKEIKIERGIPKPPNAKPIGSREEFPFLKNLKDGETVFLEEANKERIKAAIANMKKAQKWTEEMRNNQLFTVEEVEEQGKKGVRIWLDFEKTAEEEKKK